MDQPAEKSKIEGKKSKFYRKSFTLLYRILLKLLNHAYPAQIARDLNMDRQKVFYHVHRLEREGYVVKEFRDAIENYSLTELGQKLFEEIKFFMKSQKSSLYVTNASNIRNHNLAVKLKIIRSNPTADLSKEAGYHVNPANKGRIFVIAFPISMTVELYSEHVLIDFHKFRTQPTTFMNDLFLRMWKGIWYLSGLLERKYGIVVDAYEPEIVRFHQANERPDLDDKVKEKMQVTIDLGRKSKVIFPTEIPASAWMDRSMGHVEIETNDLVYEENLITMPERVSNIEANQARQIEIEGKFAEQIELHLEVEDRTLEKLNNDIEIQKKNIEIQEKTVSILSEIRDSIKASREVKL